MALLTILLAQPEPVVDLVPIKQLALSSQWFLPAIHKKRFVRPNNNNINNNVYTHHLYNSQFPIMFTVLCPSLPHTNIATVVIIYFYFFLSRPFRF